MQITGVKHFLQATSVRLMLTYLSIIMLMSIGFSIVFYNTSSHQLGRQVPTGAYFNDRIIGVGGSSAPDSLRGTIDEFFRHRIDEGRRELLNRLVFINLAALVIGGGLSYYLARRTLQPIEEAMDAQTRFVSDASHELRTPLTALQSTNEVALRKPKLTLDQAKEVMSQNVAETVKLKTLTDGLLGLLKQENQPFTPGPVALQEIASEAMNAIVLAAQAKDITVHDETPNLTLLGDKFRLVQVLTILLDNAVKYSSKKGNIYLTGETKGKYVLVKVRDEGEGIKASDIPHIFDRFYRADRSRSRDDNGGYGLGLSIARQITLQHHGEISVDSELEKGSTFIVKLPLGA